MPPTGGEVDPLAVQNPTAAPEVVIVADTVIVDARPPEPPSVAKVSVGPVSVEASSTKPWTTLKLFAGGAVVASLIGGGIALVKHLSQKRRQ